MIAMLEHRLVGQYICFLKLSLFWFCYKSLLSLQVPSLLLNIDIITIFFNWEKGYYCLLA